MKKFIFVLTLCFLISAVVPAAEWVAFSRSAEKQVSKNLVSSLGDTVRFDVVLPGLSIEKVMIDGQEYSKIYIDGSSVDLKKGYPELRKISTFLAMPYARASRIEIVDAQYAQIDDIRLLPSKGMLTRDVNPKDVPYEFNEEVYGKDVFYPADDQLVSVSKPFVMRDVAGVRAQIIPFQYNDEKKVLKVLKSVTLRVQVPASRNSSVRVNYTASQEFEKLYSSVFLNYSSPVSRSRAYNAPEVKNNLLVIAYDDFYDTTKALVNWKRKIGFDVDFKKLSEIVSGNEDAEYAIQNYIGQKYQAGELTHVMFIGDIEHIPCKSGLYEGANSDNMYVKLAGADNIPDAFTSRISVKNNTQLAAIIAKTIKYEKEPQAGAAWYKQGLAIASNQGNPKDYERAEELNTALENDLGFTHIARCYEPEYYGTSHGYNDDKSVIFDAVNQGVSMINYIGHGSEYSWVTSGFNTSDAGNVDNGMKLPVIWSVACVNGALQKDTCFAESWIRSGDENGGGCIGIAAASTNMAWVPPCVWQQEIVNNQYSKKLHETADVANLYGMLKCMEEYGVNNSDYGNQLVEQVIYFGDGTVNIRTEAPKAVVAEAVRTDGKILVSVNADSKAIADGITVTAYDGEERFDSTVVDSRGYAEIDDNGQTHVTVYSNDIVPVVDLEIQ